MIVRNCEIEGRITDIKIAKGRISQIGGNIKGERYFDAKGGALIPGLHDHHIHLNAAAAAMNCVRCGPPEVTSESELIRVLNMKGEGWLRGVGYYHSVAGEIDRSWLDNNGPNRPVRIQHRSGRLWILNSLAIDHLSMEAPKDGRLLDGDNTIRSISQFPDLRPLVNRLLSYGITGVTEVTPSNGAAEYENYIKAAKPLRLTLMGKAELSLVQSSHLKLHYHDHNLPPLEELTAEIISAHQAGRNIAAHCVTRAELMLTLAAIDMAGAEKGDRIEHAAIADEAAMEWMSKLGVIVVTQPNFIAERAAAYLKDVPREDHENLWRLKAFADRGLKLAAGSDAPFGDPNPWAAMAAAVKRPKGFEAEAISPDLALELYTKPADDAGAPARRVVIGAKADLCLLDRSWAQAKLGLDDVTVKATWIDGELVYNLID
ncbi:amidohydrolase family protein [Hellea balneolensis]|uniref:amidohydrolase family protein n=1 Tax=Hellea balneolensis TaxID=287478 RepID=UPI00040F18C8|nr:amidohydrolase family protein [Hellea balneolensis]